MDTGSTLSDFHKDDRVSYQPNPDRIPEYGTVTRVGDRFVFVKFDMQNTVMACSPKTLNRME